MIQFETKAHYEDSAETPFFLDGTVLSAGYVTEMLLQSHTVNWNCCPRCHQRGIQAASEASAPEADSP